MATAKKAEEVKTLEQLHEELAKLRGEHLESRKSHAQGELVNHRVLTNQRKSIARTLTAINHAQRASQKEEN
ncbi:50S ribosomal protein L29 [Candidatus Saccharibacteria bacterium]|nr:50S ribosomal protein L29 [Candidatus Saccharibacteria bacterium]NCS82891.1 50S ribosomal protein L29 [Candidatus Saccharibacteria bacterium]